MIELLVKEEEQLKAGDKNFDFSKFNDLIIIDNMCINLESKKEQLENEMLSNQDKIENLREQDASELENLKQMLKNLKENTEDIDYEMIRLAKDRDRRKKKLKYACEDMEVDIETVKKSEAEKKTELALAKRELQQVKDR